MDTNVKRFKYSYLRKALCVLLSFIMGVLSIVLATGFALTQYSEYKNGEDCTNYTDMSNVRLNLSIGLSEGVNNAYKNEAEYKKVLESQKKAACDNIQKKILNYIDEEYLKTSSDVAQDEPLSYEIAESVFSFVLSDTNPDIYCTNLYFEYELTENITVGNYKTALYPSIEKQYDKYVSSACESYDGDDYVEPIYKDGLIYRIEKNGKVVDSNTDLKPSEIMQKSDSFKIENGVAEAGEKSGISQETLDYIMNSNYANYKAENYKLYAYINTQNNDPKAKNLYEWYRQFSIVANDISNMKVYYVAFAAVLLIASFVLSFYYFKIAGRKNEESLAKLSFVDYVPLELQLGIVGGAGTGLGMLFFTLNDTIYDFNIMAMIFSAMTAVCWLLLFELCCSVSRYAKSGKKFYKHFLVYWLGFALFCIFKFLAKLVKKLFKAIHRFNKKLFGTFKLYAYKPKSFVKNVILLSLAFFAGNIGLMMIIVFFFAIDNPVFGFIFIVADMVANTLALRKVCLYFKSLDEIIYCASVRQDYVKDIESLPQSLKILAKSMKYTNAELQNAITKAVKDERLRAELITNVSHDLKTPLTSIITYVDLLKNCDINDPKANEYIEVLDDKGAKLKRLIDDLIEASKVTSGNVSVNLAPMNLSELCLQSTVDVQQDFEKNNLNLVVKQGDKPVMVTADGAKAFRVIENLLSNARKYSARGSRVYVSVYEENGQGVFEIKNISAEELDITPDELTERFVRGDKSRGKAEGNGLGLSIAKELCKVQNGALNLSIDGDLFKAKVSFPIVKE